MSDYAVVLQNNLVVPSSNFGSLDTITFTKDGKVYSFYYQGIKYVAIFSFETKEFIDYANEEKIDKLIALEKNREGLNYNGISLSIWKNKNIQSLDITFKNNLISAEFGSKIYGIIRDETGLCFNKYLWDYTNPYNGPKNPIKEPSAGNSFACEIFESGSSAEDFYEKLKEKAFYDLDTNQSYSDPRLVADVARLIKTVDKQMLETFNKFITIIGDHGEFEIVENVNNTFYRQDLINYRDGLKKWLEIYSKYQKELKNLSDAAQLYIICDTLYRYNMLGLLTVNQKISILLTFCKKPLMDWYFASFEKGFQHRETLVVRVIESVKDIEAEDFLEKLGNETIQVPKPNYYYSVNPFSGFEQVNMPLYSVLFKKIDDFFGEDNFTIFANKINRLVLAKNGIIQSDTGLIINTPDDLKSLVKYSYIYNKRYNTDFIGENEYKISEVTDTTFTIEEIVCTEISSYYAGGKVKSGTQIVNGTRYESEKKVLNHFDLVSVSFISNPSFLDLCENGNCTNLHFLASAAYLTYLAEKRNTKFKIEILSKSLQVLSLAFGVGELLVAIRTANFIRGLIGAYVVIGDIYSLTISSDSFIEYLQQAYPDDWQDIQETLNLISILHGITASGLSIGYSNYNLSQATKFIAYTEELSLNRGAMRILTTAEVNAMQITRERLLAEIYVLRKNAPTNDLIENSIRVFRDKLNLGIRNSRRGFDLELTEANNIIKQHRITTGNLGGGNYSFLEYNGSRFENKIWRSGTVLDGEPQIFEAIPATGGQGNVWLRNTDGEYKMLNSFASQYHIGPAGSSVYTNVTGELKIVSESTYCVSCQGVIQQFNKMFPNVNLILVDNIKNIPL